MSLLSEDPVLDVPATSRLLKVTPRTVREWCAEGKIPSRRLGRAYYIPRDALLRSLESPPSGHSEEEGCG
jgi:excisionase family DNA binding protein